MISTTIVSALVAALASPALAVCVWLNHATIEVAQTITSVSRAVVSATEAPSRPPAIAYAAPTAPRVVSVAFTGPRTAEDGSTVGEGYYTDPTPVSEYARRLNAPGRCAEASAAYAAWRPGQPLPSRQVTDTMITCLRTR